MSSYEFDQGKHAFNHWIPLEENPYSTKDEIQANWHNDWEKGWKEAEQVSKKIDR